MNVSRLNRWLIVSLVVIAILFIYYLKFPTFMSVGFTVDAKNDLIHHIEQYAEEVNEQPDDAYIDRVWKKTPGRNGRVVNIEQSYEKMKKSGEFDENLLIFDDVEPKIQLQDLSPSPIFRGHPEKDMVALMINVSWGTEYIPTILKILEQHGVKATFFIEGKWAKEHPNIVKMIHEQNHLIGNHA